LSHLARLLHLTDSALPTGSFAYSYGLESSATFGLLPDSDALRNYLYSFLQQAVSLEFPFLNSCFQLAEYSKELRALAAEYDAQLLVPPLHRASLVQASNWLRLLSSFYPEAEVGEISRWCAGQELPLHFVPAFGWSLRRVGFTLAETRAAYLHMALRDQISAAIRLGVLGPMEGHQLQHDFYAIFDDLLARPTSASYQEATRAGFLLDVTQTFHEDIYSKLFQN